MLANVTLTFFHGSVPISTRTDPSGLLKRGRRCPTETRQATYAGSVWAGWFFQEVALSFSWQVVGLGPQAEVEAEALAQVQSLQQAPPPPHCHPDLAQHFLLKKSKHRWWVSRGVKQSKQIS